MNTVMDFFGGVNTPVAIATTDAGNPKVRFFSFKMYENGKLYFLTSKQKNVYKELAQNPAIEICSMPNEQSEWVRVNGKVSFVDDLELKKKAFSMLPLLEKAYQTPENPEVIMFYIESPENTKYSMAGGAERISMA